MIKIDTLDNQPINTNIIKKFQKFIKEDKSDAMIFSDFRHGIFHRESIPTLVASIPKKIFKVADSQLATRWGNISDFKNFDLITPTEKEARFSLADQDSNLSRLTEQLKKVNNYSNLILKLGKVGVFCVGENIDKKNKNDDNITAFALSSFVDKAIDPVGAGDALLAYATLAFLESKSLVVAGILGSIAAAVKCEKDGNHSIIPSEVFNKIDDIEKMTNYLEK